MSLLLHHCRHSLGLRVLAVLACACLLWAPAPAMASGKVAHMTACQDTMHAPAGTAASASHGGHPAVPGIPHHAGTCHCPLMSGSMLPCEVPVSVAGDCLSVSYASAVPMGRVPAPALGPPLRPPSI